MREHWEGTFGELARTGALLFGDGYRTKQAELGHPGFPVLRVAQVEGGRIRHSEIVDCVRAEFRNAIGSKLSEVDDVILTTKGTFGRRARVLGDATGLVYSPQVCYFRVLDYSVLDPRFLYYWLGSSVFAAQATGLKSQTDMADYLSLRDLAGIRVRLPAIEEQRRIAGILGALDDKIELNRRLAATLEATARALHASRFESTPADVELGDVVELVREVTDPQKRPEVPFDHHSLPAFDGGGDPVREFGAAIKSVKTVVPAGSVLVSKLNPTIERVWLTDSNPAAVSICSTEFLVLKPRPPAGRAFLYCLARSDAFRQSLMALATGTSNSHQRVRTDSMLQIRVPVPSATDLASFELLAGPLLMRSVAARGESKSLREIRDALLPRLLSGEHSPIQWVTQLVGAE